MSRKNIRVESEQARGGGSGAWEGRVEPTQQVGQDRLSTNLLTVPMGLLPFAEQLPRSWRSITVPSADGSRKPRHLRTYQIYIHPQSV